MIEVLGQIVKNYSGSMKGELKLELTSECFDVGLRTLSFIYGLMEKHIEFLTNFFAEHIHEVNPKLHRSKVIEASQALLFFFACGWAHAVLHKTSTSAGTQQLHKTYAALSESAPLNSVKMIELAIKLDHFAAFPEHECVELYAAVHKNLLASTVLKQLVTSHFYMFNVDHAIRDRVCAKLHIGIEQPKAIGQRGKKFGHGGFGGDRRGNKGFA